MQQLSKVQLHAVSGGEVGATGMGDNYHYTGRPSFVDCVTEQNIGDLYNGEWPNPSNLIYCAYVSWGWLDYNTSR